MYDILIQHISELISSAESSTHQSLQVLAVLPAQTAIRLPHPVPARCVSVTSGKENDSVVRFDYRHRLMR